jgi:hypothetical protein
MSNEAELQEGEAQIVIDIGHLRDIDHSPQNIKNLSRMMGE